MDPISQIRNIKDFLTLYNSMSEHCFKKCATNFNYRLLTAEESDCVDNCATIYQKTNMRLMNQFMKMSPEMVQRRQEETKLKYEAAMQKNDAAAQVLSDSNTPEEATAQSK